MSARKYGAVRRLPLSFSLRSALAVMLLSALLLSGWRVYLHPFQRQQAAAQALREAGAKIDTKTGGANWLRLGLSEEFFQEPTDVNLETLEFRDGLLPQLLALSRLQTLVVSGEGFTKEHLHKLRGLPQLRFLILDSTSVTTEESQAFAAQHPDLRVVRSQASAITRVRAGRGKVNNSPSSIVRAVQARAGVTTASRAATTTIGGSKGIPVTVFNVAGLGPSRFFVGSQTLHARFGQHHFEFAELAQVGELRHSASTESVLAGILHLTTLKQLDVSFAGVTDQYVAVLADRMPHLEHLNLSGANITDEGLRQIARLSELKILELYRTPIGDAGLAHITKLENLTVLDVRYTNAGDAGVAHLADMRQLLMLKLAGTKITDGCAQDLSKLTALQWLDVSKTEITQQATKELEKQLPGNPIVR